MSKQSDLVSVTQGANKLTVSGYSNVDANNKLAIGNVADYQGLIHMESATETLTIENTSDYPSRATIFKDNGTERMRIDSSGNVGIGTSSPTAELTLYKASGDLALDITRGSNRWTIGEYDNNNLIQIGGLYGVHSGIQLNASGYLKCQGVYNDSAADSANVVVDGTGNIYRSTSALKYKQDIRDIEEIDISQFRPVRYKSNLERDDQTKDHFGFIADEAHDAGYTELVSYGVPDEETGVAEVEGFRYDRMTVLLTKVIQQQQATIDALEARVAALEAV